jgi:Mg/Co/Ni transporter MgtE
MSFSADMTTEDLAKKFKVAKIALYLFAIIVGIIAGVCLGIAIFLTIYFFESTHTIPDFWINSPPIIGGIVGGFLVVSLVGFIDKALSTQEALLLSESQ